VEFSTLNLSDAGQKFSEVNLSEGLAYVNWLGSDGLTLNFSREKVALNHPAHFRLETSSDLAKLAVFKGDVVVEGPGGKQTVSKKQMAEFNVSDQDQFTLAKAIDEAPLDSWDRESIQYHEQYARNNSPVSGYGASDLHVTQPMNTAFNRYETTWNAGVGGQYDPFAFETLLNASFLPFEVPRALAHEWSHAAGFGDEGDANLIGTLTCLRSSDPLIRYSGAYWTYGELPESDRRRIHLKPAVLADFYPERDRNRILSIFYLAIPVGAALGYLAGGEMGSLWGWRAPFFVCAIPGLAIAALVALTVNVFAAETKNQETSPAGLVSQARFRLRVADLFGIEHMRNPGRFTAAVEAENALPGRQIRGREALPLPQVFEP